MASLEEKDRPENFENRKGTCTNALTALAAGQFTTKLKRLKKNLEAAATRFQALPCACSAKLAQLNREIEAALSSIVPAPETAPQEPPISPPGTSPAPAGRGGTKEKTAPLHPAASFKDLAGFSGLEEALHLTEKEIGKAYQRAYDSFQAYSPRSRRMAPLHALWYSLAARHAEALYRLGRRCEARRIWNQMLLEDRLDSKVLKNLSVCDTGAGDVARTLNSWRSYVEMLYCHDLIADSPRSQARSRAEFHRAIGNAYAPAFLVDKLDTDWHNKVEGPAFLDFISFVGSPSRVQNFIDHKWLEFINARLDCSSPPLIVGVSRSEGEEVRTTARDKMLAFLEKTAPLLPERVGRAFPKLVKRHLEQAFAACASAKRLTLKKDPRYPEEKDRLLQVLSDICQLKIKLFQIAMQKAGQYWTPSPRIRELARHMTSVDFLAQLARLDDIPIDLSNEFLQAAAGGLTAKEMVDFVKKNFNSAVIMSLLEFVLADDGNAAEQPLRQRQYRRLIDHWVKHPAMAEYLDNIDDPQSAYPRAVREALQGGPSDEAKVILRRLHEHFPELTGPARWLAHLLQGERRFQEAIAILDRACKKGFHESAVLTCRFQRMVALQHASAMIKDLAEVKSLLERCCADAAYLIDNAPDPKKTMECRQCRMFSSIHLGDLAKEYGLPWFEQACTDADYILAYSNDEKEIGESYFCRMLAWSRRAVIASKAHDRDTLKKCMQQALQDAGKVENHSHNPDHLDQARKLRQELDEVLKSI
jgi:tetratricopeptide (TPR) repeat protein